MKNRAGIPTALWMVAGLLLALAPVAGAQGQDANPFALPDGVRFLSQLRPVPSHLKLQAIVSGKNRRWATINNRNYAEGDQVEGHTVLTIYKDRVTLADGPGRVELMLNRSSIPVRVTPPTPPD